MVLSERHGRQSLVDEARVETVRFDASSGRIIAELTNGCGFAFPARMGEGLEGATDDDLAEVEILGRGYALHWEKLDVDLSILGLLAGLFGTRRHMDRLRAARAGRATSTAKADAAQRRKGRTASNIRRLICFP
jgi:hypothetical protein